MKTQMEGVILIFDGTELAGFIVRDPETGHKLIYKCEQMDMEEIATLIDKKPKEVKVK